MGLDNKSTLTHNLDSQLCSPSAPRALEFANSERSETIVEQEKVEEDENEDEEEDDKEPNWQCPHDPSTEYGVDKRDEGTSDHWVKRHPDLIRLTGRHPFNGEPSLPRLLQHGFLTPTSIHYVRNHGYVPQAVYDEWEVEVCGLVKRPQVFRMRQLVEEFRPRQLPVTLVCAGNRRKEQNMVKQTKGFNWGPAAVGTSVWRGTKLCDVLRRCGIYSKKKGALHVCLDGGEMLPGGGGSRYGTSISVDVALDESQDILLAYMQNGNLLEPDHGFPVRMIIPGYIGGRMVKWLTRIEVTDKESENYYHYNDNRVLPSHVDEEKANAEGWWYKPDYIINELNINSVITSPAHGEVVPVDTVSPYTVRGYAYSGGGRKVTRVEVTVDAGRTWKLGQVTHPEKPTKYGKYWCWCFWQVDMGTRDLLQVRELAVRAWDASMNTQPQHLTWNVMGMMNNCWYRLRISSCKPQHGSIRLAFEHPICAGSLSGGWMSPRDSASDLSGGWTSPPHTPHVSSPPHEKSLVAKIVSTPSLNRERHPITISEVKQHDTPQSTWIVVHNSVYDCTKFLTHHPGGKDSILINAGSDCTEEFDAIHSLKAKAMLEDFKIGELINHGSTSSVSMPKNNGGKVISTLTHMSMNKEVLPQIALDGTKKIRCRLISKTSLSHDVRLLRFALPHDDDVLGLPVGKHVYLLVEINGKLCMRSYTPVSSRKEMGYFDLLVKIYFKGINMSFPQGGLMSQHLDSLRIGETVDVKGPLGHIHYLGKGSYEVDGEVHFMKSCAMLAGGTGITPMYQVMREMLDDMDDLTKIYLIFANKREEDIVLRVELDKWVEKHSRLQVWYVVSSPPKTEWRYSIGHINEEIIKMHFPPASPETTVFVCGPVSMIEEACLPNLKKLGYSEDLTYTF